jgi:hypothetical protein
MLTCRTKSRLPEHSIGLFTLIIVVALAATAGCFFGPSLVRYIKMTLM